MAEPRAWRVVLAPGPRRGLDGLDPSERSGLLDLLRRLQADPGALPARPLPGRPEWLLRQGPWRLLVRADGLDLVLVALGRSAQASPLPAQSNTPLF